MTSLFIALSLSFSHLYNGGNGSTSFIRLFNVRASVSSLG